MADLSDDDYEAIASEVLDRLGTGVHGDRVLLTRRQAIALSTGALSLGALGTLGAEEASAQSAGAVGTSSEPVNLFGYDVEAENSITDAAGVTHNGELADLSDTASAFAVEDSGTTVLTDASGINFDTELDASDDGDGTVTASVAAEVVADGDGIDREIWVIANGASDPAGADPVDIIFEEEA